MIICEKAKEKKNNKAHLGSTYEQPQGYTKAYMGGSDYFTIKEIEVFAIGFK
jgi:hypothetical protein